MTQTLQAAISLRSLRLCGESLSSEGVLRKGTFMSSTLFLIFNHQVGPLQEADAHASLGVDRLVGLPDELQRLWTDIPPELAELDRFLAPIKEWLKESARPGDPVLIQGDFGACCLLVRFAMERGLVPVYSTTTREATEEMQPDGTIKLTHRFQHRIFRKYGV